VTAEYRFLMAEGRGTSMLAGPYRTFVGSPSTFPIGIRSNAFGLMCFAPSGVSYLVRQFWRPFGGDDV
jgi:hypothetical protein